MSAAVSLTSEWERIDLLCAYATAARQGVDLPDEIHQRLNKAQQSVEQLRAQSPWQDMLVDGKLDPVDLDILACCIAPEAEPRLAWIYQDLQGGSDTVYPTPALLRELFVVTTEQAPHLYQRLAANSPLVQNGFLQTAAEGLFEPIKPSAKASSQLLGWQTQSQLDIPGALPVETGVTWHDLVLPEQCLRKLKEFSFWVTHRHIVETNWKGRVPGGPIALLCGSSGTGKTLASEVIANALGYQLFRVDIGLLVSKYIGETEKNLNALFDAAHNQPVVLLFDEADALFSKRGEVREARDRYANMEVSHLLSRIERHIGPCILTSNLRDNIDSAFTRRFQMVIDFPRPDSDARIVLWNLHLPPGAPIDPKLDIPMLARECNLCGGQIRNAALHAAFLAAAEETEINTSHIASAVWTELAKKRGELSSNNLGALADYLPFSQQDIAQKQAQPRSPYDRSRGAI